MKHFEISFTGQCQWVVEAETEAAAQQLARLNTNCGHFETLSVRSSELKADQVDVEQIKARAKRHRAFLLNNSATTRHLGIYRSSVFRKRTLYGLVGA
jgi:hypothetical protein